MAKEGTPKLAQLAKEFAAAYAELAEAKERKEAAQKNFDHYKLEVIPDALAEESITTCTVEGIGRLGLTVDCYVTILVANRGEAYQWMKDNDFGDLVVDYVHYSTLKSWMMEQSKAGNVPPLDLFKFDPFVRAAITKR